MTDTRKIKAYDFLRRGILDQSFPPGHMLVEESIAAQLDMSRTPVREALRELSRDGLVEITPNRAAVVRSLSSRELLDIFDIKIRLEGLCAARAAERSSSTTAAKLVKATKAMAASAKTRDRQAYLRADETFHSAIYAGAQNERAHQIVNDLNAQWQRVRAGTMVIESRMETAVEEHRRIAEAIGTGDAGAAEVAMRVHLENLRDEIQVLLETLYIPMGAGR